MLNGWAVAEGLAESNISLLRQLQAECLNFIISRARGLHYHQQNVRQLQKAMINKFGQRTGLHYVVHRLWPTTQTTSLTTSFIHVQISSEAT